MKKIGIALLLVTAAVAALLAGIVAGKRQAAPEAVVEAPAAATAQLFATTLNDPAGRPQALAQWRGKVLVVNFWAAWCPPCREEMPAFSRLQKEFGANSVQFVGIALDSAQSVNEFQQQTPVVYPLLIASPATTELARQLGNPSLALPYTLVLDAAGKVRHTRLGGLQEAELAALIKPLLSP